MTNITPFNFNDNEVRVIERSGEPWLVARDVCDVLELSNLSEALKAIDEEDLTSEKLTAGGQVREMKLINESGVYALVFRSNKPEAKKFRKWVTSEVLPAIRKTGSYQAPAIPKQPKTVIEAARVFKALKGFAVSVGLKGNQAVLSANNATLKCTDINLLELTDQTALIADKPDALLTPTELGMQLGGLSAMKTNVLLEEGGYQTNYRDAKSNKHWEMTATGGNYGEALDTGKKHSNGTPIKQVKWYSRIVQRLKEQAA